MSLLEVAAISVLGIPMLVLAFVRLLRSPDSTHSKVFAVTVIVGGGLVQSNLLPKSTIVPLLILAVVGVVALRRREVPEPGSSFDRAPSARAWAMLALWGFLFAVNLVANAGLSNAAAFGRLLPGTFWVLVVLVVGGTRVTIGSVTAAMQLALGVVTVGAVALGSAASRPCDEFKCGALGSIYRGAFDSENYLGILCALTLVATVAAVPAGQKLLGWNGLVYLLVLVILFASSSRTSALAATCGIVATLVARRARPSRPPGPGRTRIFPSSLAGYVSVLPWMTCAMALYLIYSATGASFSNRGAVWTLARRQLQGHELFGLGIGRWEGYEGVNQISRHFAHSEFLLTYFSGGLVGLLGLMLFVAMACKHAMRTRVEGVFLIGYATTFMVIGLTEVVFNPMTVDGLTWTVLPFLVGAVLLPAERVLRLPSATGLWKADPVRAAEPLRYAPRVALPQTARDAP